MPRETGGPSPEEIQKFESTRIHNPEVAESAARYVKLDMECAQAERKRAALFREVGDESAAREMEMYAARLEQIADDDATQVQLDSLREDINASTLETMKIRIQFEIAELQREITDLKNLYKSREVKGIPSDDQRQRNIRAAKNHREGLLSSRVEGQLEAIKERLEILDGKRTPEEFGKEYLSEQ